MAVTPQLTHYVNQARAAGMDDAAIKQELLKVGWDVNDVNAVLPPQTPEPPQPVLQEPFRNTQAAIQSSGVKLKKYHSRALLYVVIATILVLGSAVYLFLPQITNLFGGIGGFETQIPSDDSTSDIVPSSTTDIWETYTNPVYGFSFEYPQGWYVGGGQRENNQFFICLNPAGQSGDCTALLTIDQNVDLQNRYDAIKNMFKNNGGSVSESNLFIGGASAQLLVIDLPSGFSRSALWGHDGYVYNLETLQGRESLFTHIVSTFNFSDGVMNATTNSSTDMFLGSTTSQ